MKCAYHLAARVDWLLFNRSSKAFVKNTELKKSSRGRRRQRRQNNKTQDFSQHTSITEMNAVKVNRCLLPFTLWRFPIHLSTCVHRHSAINSKLQPSFFRQVYLRVRTMETAITDMRRTFFAISCTIHTSKFIKFFLLENWSNQLFKKKTSKRKNCQFLPCTWASNFLLWRSEGLTLETSAQ